METNMEDKNKKKIPESRTPWLDSFDGPPTTKQEKEQFRFEYAHESKTNENTLFKNITPET